MRKKICLWRRLYLDLIVNGTHRGCTTFGGYGDWDDTHPLYKCTECSGFDMECVGFKPIRKKYDV